MYSLVFSRNSSSVSACFTPFCNLRIISSNRASVYCIPVLMSLSCETQLLYKERKERVGNIYLQTDSKYAAIVGYVIKLTNNTTCVEVFNEE